MRCKNLRGPGEQKAPDSKRLLGGGACPTLTHARPRQNLIRNANVLSLRYDSARSSSGRGEERKEGRGRNRVVEMSEGHCGEMVLTNHAVTNRHCLPLITHLPSAIGRGERTLHHVWKPMGERVGSRNLGGGFLGANKPHKRLTSLSLFAPRLNRLGLCCHCLGFGKGSSASVREGGRDAGTARSRGTERGGHLNRHKSGADPHEESGSTSTSPADAARRESS